MKNRQCRGEIKKQMRLAPGYLLLVVWLAFLVASIGWLVLASLSTTREIFSNTLLTSGVHFSNYVDVWVENSFARYFLNSIVYTLSSVLAVILIAAPASYVLARKLKIGKKLLSNSFLIAMAIPVVVIAIPMYSIFTRMHLTGKMLPVILIYTAAYVPYTVYFLASFFATLPSELEDAALVDGCTPAQTFWRIFFPLAQPGIMTVSIFNFMTVWNEYIIAYIFSTRSEIRPLSVALQAIIQALRVTGNWSGLFAAVMIVFLPTFLIFIVLSDKIVVGITGGAVKG